MAERYSGVRPVGGVATSAFSGPCPLSTAGMSTARNVPLYFNQLDVNWDAGRRRSAPWRYPPNRRTSACNTL